MKRFIYNLIKKLYDNKFMQSKFYKKYCYNSVIGDNICKLILWADN